MIVTIDGKVHHLAELDFIERLLYNVFSPEEFYKDLIKFLNESKEIDLRSKTYLTYEEIKHVDGFIQNYFDKRIEEAKIYFLRAYIIGKLLAESDRLGGKFELGIERIKHLPKFIQDAAKKYHLTLEETEAMKQAVESGASLVSNVATTTQQTIKANLIESIQRNESYTKLEEKIRNLFDEEGELNRDWRRIAITETNIAFANGYLSMMNEGEYVIGISMADACEHCLRDIHLKVYKVLSTPPADYSEMHGDEYNKHAEIYEKYVWAGKNNYGRSTSKRKRIDKTRGNAKDNLIEREHHELSMPAIPYHPNCRCRWVAFNPKLQYVENGEIKLKNENPEAHQRWYEENIEE